jgi:dTDP-4-amino-4,6-dideoxygalactose transaminase
MGHHIKTEGPLECIVYSFQAVKNLATADSGMICFKDEQDDFVARQLSWLGIDKDTYARTNSEGTYKWYYDVPNLGYKYNGNSIMACIGLVELRYLDQGNAYRRTLANWYREILEPEGIKCISHTNQDHTSQHLFQIIVDNRDKVMLSLNNCSVYPGVHYRTNAIYKIFNQDINNTPKATIFSNSVISLPMHMDVTKADVDYIAEKILQSVIIK